MADDIQDWGPSESRDTHDLGQFAFEMAGYTGLTSHLTEASLAASVPYVALSKEPRDEFDNEFIRDFLLAIADALDSEHAFNKLKIVRPRGRSESFVEAHLRESRYDGVIYDTFEACKRLRKLEAAIAETVGKYKISRATVFRALKRVALEARELAVIDPPCCSPPESREFEIWLDRFATSHARK